MSRRVASRRTAIALVVAAAGALVASCKDEQPPVGSSGAPAATLSAPLGSSGDGSATAAVPGRASFRTTSHEIAVGNIDARINGMQKVLAKADSATTRGKLCGELLSRFQFLGTTDDLLEAAKIAEGLVEGAPDEHEALVLRARGRSAVHRFDDALKDLEAADAIRKNQVADARASIWEGQGRYDEALAVYKEINTKNPTSVNLVLEAGLLGKMGKTADADKLFDKAIAEFRGINTFAAAWIYYEWGAMWERAGDLTKAKNNYALALDRLPEYAHAAGHMALLVPPSEGIALLEGILKRSNDPEYRGQLGRLKNLVQPGSGDADIEAAKKGFDELLEKAPLAFADHAGWFWLGPGSDPKKAAEVAAKNLAGRKTPEAYLLSLSASLAADDVPTACKVADDAAKVTYPTPALQRELKQAAERCGKAPGSASASPVASAPPSAPPAPKPAPVPPAK